MAESPSSRYNLFKNLFSSQILSGGWSRTKGQAVKPTLKAPYCVTGVFSVACSCDTIKICASEEQEFFPSYLAPLGKPLSHSELPSSPLQEMATHSCLVKVCTVGMKKLRVPPSAGRQGIKSAFLSGNRRWPAVHRSGINFCLIKKLGGKNWVT